MVEAAIIGALSEGRFEIMRLCLFVRNLHIPTTFLSTAEIGSNESAWPVLMPDELRNFTSQLQYSTALSLMSNNTALLLV